MATEFMTLENNEPKEKKKTVFNKILLHEVRDLRTNPVPSDYDKVLYLGNHEMQGDMFKAWRDNNPSSFVIFFGEKGDEFDD